MVVSCWVNGCTNRADGKDKKGFYSIPVIRENEGEFTKSLTEKRRRLWLANLNRKDLPTKYSKICSDHFVNGKPASMYDQANPDWIPTLRMFQELTPTKSMKKVRQADTDNHRFIRANERQKTKEKHEVARALLFLQETQELSLDTTVTIEEPHRETPKCCKFFWKGRTEKLRESSPASPPPPKSSVTTEQIQQELQRHLTDNAQLREKLDDFKMTQDSFKENDDKVKYYTGLPNYASLEAVLNIVSPYFPPHKNLRLTVFDKLLMTLMRLKLNLHVKDLAYRFKTSQSTVSRIFLHVIHVMYQRMEHLIYWPSRDELRLTTPLEFRLNFGQKTAVIIDCFEIFMQRPKSLLARSQTWSQYKHHNTVKFLIGITPQGSISFISHGWGGRTSDKCITESCGILNKLLPGDLVLADRGFDIADSVGLFCAQVNIPSFTKGRLQLSATDVETTRKIAHVRIHVERVIGLVRNRYTIMQGKVPIDFMCHEEGEIPPIDKIVTVCCALVNFSGSVVGFD